MSNKSVRRQYVVNPKLQYRVAFQILAALLGIASLWLIGMSVLAGPEAISQLEPDEVRSLMFKVNAIYFGLGASIVVVLTLLLTHRVAGPAYVIGRAIRDMQDGNYEPRLGLRDRDFLKPLAAELKTLAEKMKMRDADSASARSSGPPRHQGVRRVRGRQERPGACRRGTDRR